MSEFTKTTLVWEEFGEAMEKDFQLAPKKFWQTLRRLKNGKQGMAQAVTRWGADLLTALLPALYQSGVVKELSRRVKLSIYRSIYIPTLTYGHEL